MTIPLYVNFLFLLFLCPSGIPEDVEWHDVRTWGIEGKAWEKTERYFDRLPEKAREMVREPVWNLSRHSAGMCVLFETDATIIRVRYSLYSDRLAMAHMPATGVSGLDLYGEVEKGRLRWLSTIKPGATRIEATIAKGIAPGLKKYALYLPLYNGVDSLEIGVDAGVRFRPIPPRKEKPVVFYGTSITQGGCASRPGMAYPAILGRRLDVPVVNLGFSGNGKMELELGDLLGEIDAAVYVIDCLPNMRADQVAERAEVLVTRLRAARPLTPILFVEDRSYSNSPMIPALMERNVSSRRELKKVWNRLVASGVKDLLYLEGDVLLGEDGEGTVDGSHPTDLGMVRYADAMEPLLRKILDNFNR